VTLTNALPGDPLYRFARDANIRIVDIEAGLPWSLDAPGVALADAPSSTAEWGGDKAETAVAPYFWLSCRTRFAWATSSRTISSAVSGFSGDDRDEPRAAQALRCSRCAVAIRTRSSRAVPTSCFALTGDFVYLTNDMGLFVDGYFIKQGRALDRSGSHGVDEAPARARHQDRAARVGAERSHSERHPRGRAKLVVLDGGDPGIVVERALVKDGLQQILRKNLDAIVAAGGE
jgi:hypothetical protein